MTSDLIIDDIVFESLNMELPRIVCLRLVSSGLVAK